MKDSEGYVKRSSLLASLYAPEESGYEEIGRGHLEAQIQLAAAFQYREEGIVEHLRRIAAYVEILAGAMGWSEQQIQMLRTASVYHDTGMVDVPGKIIKKQGALEQEEMEELKKHSALGRALLQDSNAPVLDTAAMLAWTHHERFDGSGYPRGLKGEDTPLGARILAVADVFDALTTSKPYKEAYPFEIAIDIIDSKAGSHFDPEVVQLIVMCREGFEEICSTLATSLTPSRKGFRISARDRSQGDVFSIAKRKYFNCPFCQQLHPQSTNICPVRDVALNGIHKLSGVVLDDKYRLGGVMGVGGMGVVYEATHMMINRKLAIKFLDPEIARDKASLTRFYNEARVFSRVGHPNLVEVTDMGWTGEGLPYIVMELLEGTDLAHLVYRRGKLADITAVTIAIDILRTLAAVHRQNIIHRDLKPENVYLVVEDGREKLKLLDFGIASLMDELKTKDRLTQEGVVFGTPQYMSPEQAMGSKNLDGRSDLFAVGSLLYEMVTGEEAFKGDNSLAVIASVSKGSYRPPREINARLSGEVEAIINKALTADLSRRYQDADEFIEALVEVAKKDSRFEEGRILDLWFSADPASGPGQAGADSGQKENVFEIKPEKKTLRPFSDPRKED